MNTYSPQPAQQNYIYLYDLPKKEYTSVKLAEYLREKAGVELERQPQVRRDINRPFFSAIITIQDSEKFKKAAEALRYFEIGGKPCRGLPFDNELLGSNTQKLVENNIFVRKIPTNLTPSELEKEFSNYGPVKSLKISLNPDHSSRGYGFVCFQESNSAKNALQDRNAADTNHTVPYAPKDKRDVRRAFNNIYVKNMPEEWTEAEVKKEFEAYGRIESLYCGRNDKGLYAFVCYCSEDKQDREYGPKCAREAIDNLNGKDMGDGKNLYVKEALKAEERESERMRDNRKFKNSKKRCNLYVKGFPDSYTDADLRNLFEPFGEIESLRLFPMDGHKKPYAFVCYKAPDQATTAKNELTKSTTNNRALIINHYEIKEQREVLVEDQKDKLDFQNYRKQNMGSMPIWSDLAKREELIFYLNQIVASFKLNKGGVQGQRQNQQQRPNRPQMQPRPQGMMMPQPGMPGMPMPNMPMPSAAQMQQLAQMTAGATGMPSAGPNTMMQQPVNSTAARYAAACSEILPSVVPQNEMYRTQVGTVIYDYVIQISGPERAPKITGMLIDLPLQDIHIYMQSHDQLVDRVRQAEALLNQQEAAAAGQQAAQ